MSATNISPSSSKDGGRSQSVSIFVPTLVVLAVPLADLVVLASVWTDVQRYSQLKTAKVFWTQWGWAIALGTFGTLLVSLSAFVNHIVARTGERAAVQERIDQHRRQIKAYPWLARLFVPLVLGIVFGAQPGSR